MSDDSMTAALRTPAPRERPMIFSAPMVRALLAGTKTKTRRIVFGSNASRPGVARSTWGVYGFDVADLANHSIVRVPWNAGTIRALMKAPHGEAGDRLWVREGWALRDDLIPAAGVSAIAPAGIEKARHYVRYRATHDGDLSMEWHHCSGWRTPLFMPRWASRILLAVTAVRVERVQDITEDDARAEGIAEPAPVHGKWCDPAKGREGHWSYRKLFADLWNTIHGGGAWERNDWVWVYSTAWGGGLGDQ